MNAALIYFISAALAAIYWFLGIRWIHETKHINPSARWRRFGFTEFLASFVWLGLAIRGSNLGWRREKAKLARMVLVPICGFVVSIAGIWSQKTIDSMQATAALPLSSAMIVERIAAKKTDTEKLSELTILVALNTGLQQIEQEHGSKLRSIKGSATYLVSVVLAVFSGAMIALVAYERHLDRQIVETKGPGC